MKYISILISFLFIFSNLVHAQQRAVTSNGDEVILNDDGTWKYAKDAPDYKVSKADTNKIKFTKPSDAFFVVKSTRVPYGVYIDPKKWSFEKSGEEDASEFDFTLKSKDAYGMLITEKIEIPIETLKMAALGNAKRVSTDIQVVKEEYRNVNGKTILLLQMDGTVHGIKFTYLGYYFSSSKGTIQLLTYTATKLKDEYYEDLEELLNGFVELNN